MPCLTCTICSEVYKSTDVLYSTGCGHVFHFSCMQQWRSRSTSCPQCREHNPNTHRIFLDFDETDTDQKLNEVKSILDQTEKSRCDLQLEMDSVERNLLDIQRILVETEEKKIELESANQYLQAQNDSREEEIGKLINNCSLKASEEAELLRVQLISSEERLKEVLLELEQKNEECLKLRETNAKQEKTLERSKSIDGTTRGQYEAVERGLKVQIEYLIQQITTKTTLIENQNRTIAELKEHGNVDCDNNATEMLMQKMKLERELEKSLDKIIELEECNIRTMEMLNLEIESLKADNERKDIEIKNRRDEHAKMMQRLSSLGSKATEISLRKRNEILSTKLEETRRDLENLFKICAEKDATIKKLNQTENIVQMKLNKSPDREQLEKLENSERRSEKSSDNIVDQPLNNTSSGARKIEVGSNENRNVTSVVMKGIPQDDVKVPLIDTVLMYTQIMDLHCKSSDIKDVFKLERKFKLRNNIQGENISLVVKFVCKNMKIKFLANKEILKPRGILVSEFQTNEVNMLFHYAKSLKSVGYKNIFCKNNNVFVKLNASSPLIKIKSKQDVNNLLKTSKIQQKESEDNSMERVDEANQMKHDPKTNAEECDVDYYRQ